MKFILIYYFPEASLMTIRTTILLPAFILLAHVSAPVCAQEYNSVIRIPDNGPTGNSIAAPLYEKNKNELYGVSFDLGGKSGGGRGAVFKISKINEKWKSSLVSVFRGDDLGEADGSYPESSVVSGLDGRLYGTTGQGGKFGCGTAFAITLPTASNPKVKREKLVDFKGGVDSPCSPGGRLMAMPDGSFIGTSVSGGGFDGSGDSGTVWRLEPPETPSVKWKARVIALVGDGLTRVASVTPYGRDTFIGTTQGRFLRGGGLFKISKPEIDGDLWKFEKIHQFYGGRDDGFGPMPDIVVNYPNEIYGVTSNGGKFTHRNCSTQASDGRCGTFYKFSLQGKKWSFEILYNFRPTEKKESLPYWPKMLAVNRSAPGSFIVGTDGTGADLPGSIATLSPPTAPGKEWKIKTLHTFDGYASCCAGFSAESKTLYSAFGDGGYKFSEVFAISPTGK